MTAGSSPASPALHQRRRRGRNPVEVDGQSIDHPGAGPHTCTMPRKAAPAKSPVADFEQSLDSLEQLVDKMEHGEMTLEQSLDAYERGVGFYRKCQVALEQAELRVRKLSDPQDESGAEPFGADSPAAEPSGPDKSDDDIPF